MANWFNTENMARYRHVITGVAGVAVGIVMTLLSMKMIGPGDAQKIVDALNGLQRYDLGGLELGFSPTDHTGLDYVELSIIGRDGKFHR